MISLSLLISFCSCIIFLIPLNCLSVFYSRSLSFLQITILNSFPRKIAHLHFGKGFTRKLCSFGYDIFPWFFMFLQVLHCCLCIWKKSSHITQSLLTGFRKEKLLLALLGILRFSQIFSMDTPAPYFLFSFVGEFLRSYAFCTFCIVRSSTNSHPFAFPRAVLHVQVSAWFFSFVVVVVVFQHCRVKQAFSCVL